jgi:hypothetical protein
MLAQTDDRELVADIADHPKIVALIGLLQHPRGAGRPGRSSDRSLR